MTLRRKDGLGATAVGVIALAVYLWTVAPGLVAVTDTPMFQFIGKVLGVAHNPGYPLFALVTHVFSYLPFGPLAYRINCFSAVMGAVTAAAVFLIARRLDCGFVVSASAALGLAFGQVFWSQAVIAEVYTLNAAIVAGMLLCLLTWGQTGRRGYFFAAVGLLALGLGNHTTIAGFAPAMAVYALLVDRRFVLRARTMATAAAMLVAGLLQYGFILIRSRQPGTYVESPATTLSALFDVMRGKQFSQQLFVFDWRTVLADRIPFLVGQILLPELTMPALLMACVGAAFLLRRRLADSLLLLLGGGAIFVFVLNYSVVDTPVFLIPAILVLWLLAAVGTQQAARAAARVRRADVAVMIAVLILPTWNLVHNFEANDRSRDTEAREYFDRLFAVLPSRSVFVQEDFLVDRMVMFKLLGDNAAGSRQITLETPDASALRAARAGGAGVFAFFKSIRGLRYQGLDFDFAPYPLLGGAPRDFLTDVPDGVVVAIAVPAIHTASFIGLGDAALRSIGGADNLRGRTQSAFAMVGVRGARRGAVNRIGSHDATVDVPAGAGVGTTGVTVRAAVHAHADATEAVVRVNGRDVARTTEGAAMVLWYPNGRIRSFVLQAVEGFRVPLPVTTQSVHLLRGSWPTERISTNAWAHLEDTTATGNFMVSVAPATSVVLYVSGPAPLAPRVVDRSSEGARVDIAGFASETTSELRAALEKDGIPDTSLGLAANTYRIHIAAIPEERASVSVELALGGIPSASAGRLFAADPSAIASGFRINTLGLLRSPDRVTELLLMSRDEQSQLVGSGWSAVDADVVGGFRWMTEAEARLILPVTLTAPSRVSVQARADDAAGDPPPTIRLRVNAYDLPAHPLVQGWHTYEWTMPAGAMSTGINQAGVAVDGVRPRSVAVGELAIHAR